ncbi:MAG: hypothetical protein H6844_03815 [Alphaproteobacteria bacterium]|nr:hypothetical protein [Alphaproteobacteria bacterium]
MMRAVVGLIACALYAWRVSDPKASYAAFYDASNWLTGWLLDAGGLAGVARNVVNLVLVDQAEGFLLGIVFLSVLQAPLWAARKGGGWCWRRVLRLRNRRRAARGAARGEQEPLPLGPPVATGRDRPEVR